METRILPRAEWAKLAGTELEPALAVLPDGDDTQIIVIEDAGVIVGSWGLLWYPHAEGLWIHPNHRKRGRVAFRLLQAMDLTARRGDIRAVVTSAVDPDVRALILKQGGVQLPGEHFVMPIGGV